MLTLSSGQCKHSSHESAATREQQVHAQMTVATVITAKPKDLGGFQVRRALPVAQLRAVGPFVFLDQMGPARIPAGQGLDVRPHPHIGLSTMTYLYEGEILHRDSLGTVQPISPGAINWMLAGRGIVHSERSPSHLRAREHRLFGLQFWVALPRAQEEAAPSFRHIDRDSVPALHEAGVDTRLLAGSMDGVAAPFNAPHPMICVDFEMVAGAATRVSPGWPERALYVSAGDVEIADARFSEGQLIVLAPGAEARLRALSNARVMLIGGEPLDGPRHIWWNFVSSSQDRIEQAKADWKAGRFAAVPGETEFIPLPD